MNVPSHIALVGCGFTGTSAFYQLVDRYPAKEITIFEATGDFGPGYPYKTDECSDYLINNTTDTMCLTPASRRAFVDWLSTRQDLVPQLDERGHLPRTIFGKFLKDVFSTTRTAAAEKGIKVNLVPFEVTRISEKSDGRVHLEWDEGTVLVDAAILSTGRCPDRDDYQTPPEGSTAKYIANHVMSSDLDDIGSDATIHILGASLSAYDVINRLYSPDTGCRFERMKDGRLAFEAGPNQRHVVLCSRSGRLKAMQSQHPGNLTRCRFTSDALRTASGNEGLTLRDIQSRIQDEAEHHGADVDWATVINPYDECESAADVSAQAERLLENAINAATDPNETNFLVDLFADSQFEVWDAFADHVLNASEERAYRSKVETAVLAYAAPCPVPTAEKLLALQKAGRLRVVKGVRETQLQAGGDGYEIVHDFGTDIATVLVNATGATQRDVTSPEQSDLVRSMVDAGLLSQYKRDDVPMLGASVDMNRFRSDGSRNIYLANMLLWGPGFFTSSAIMMATIVERIIDSLLSPLDTADRHLH